MKVERKIVDTDHTEEEEKETRPKKKQKNIIITKKGV